MSNKLCNSIFCISEFTFFASNCALHIVKNFIYHSKREHYIIALRQEVNNRSNCKIKVILKICPISSRSESKRLIEISRSIDLHYYDLLANDIFIREATCSNL